MIISNRENAKPKMSKPASKGFGGIVHTENLPGHNAFLALCAFVAFLGVSVFFVNVVFLHQSDVRIFAVFGAAAMSAIFWMVNRSRILPWTVVVYCLVLIGGFSVALASIGGNLRYPAFPFFYVVFLACGMASGRRGIVIMAAGLLASILHFGIQEVRLGFETTPNSNALFITHLLTFVLLALVAHAAAKSNELREDAERSLERQRQATREESKLLADVVDSIDDTFVLWSADNKLIFGNRSFYDAYQNFDIEPGLSYDVFVKRTVDAGLFEFSNANKTEYIAERISNRHSQNPKRELLRRTDGRIFSLSVQRLPNNSVVSMARDITNDHVNEKRLELATRSLTIWDWDILNDHLYFSPSFADRLGYSAPELKEARSGAITNLMHPDDVPTYLAKLDRSLNNSHASFVNEHRFKAKNGEYITFLATGETSFNSRGEAVRFSGVLTDITEQRNLEERLHQAQKMEAIGHLTGGVAHDFNNILAVILGNFELIRETRNTDEINDLTDAGVNAAQKGADLTRNLLNFAGKARLEPDVFSLNEIVLETQKWSASGVPEHIELNVALSDDLQFVEADPSLVQTALLNLILNARDAMQDGGALTIETSNVHFDEDVISGAGDIVPKGHYALLAVSDTGLGISPEDLAQIYDPFFTTKPPGSGSGLGLSMVQGFMHQSGGFIKAYSEPGVGTTLKLFFPAMVDKSPSTALPAPPKIDPPQENTRILVVEDQYGVLEVLVKTLTRAGYDVRFAHSGDEAAELWKTDKAFDLLLTDVVMPGKLQGPMLAQHIRQTAPDLPVIFMSGYPREATVHGNGLKHEDIRLMKPVAKREILFAISTALNQSLDNS